MTTVLAVPQAAQAAVTDPNNAAVQYAEAVWNWDSYDSGSHGTVAAGSAQDNFQCAEFVARALAFEGLIPNLAANSPQSAVATYTATNGRVYHLWNVGTDSIAGLYNFLVDTGLGKDIGDNPSAARPGDVVFYYNNSNRSAASRFHTTLLTQTGAPADTRYTGHNIAERDLPYATSTTRSIVHINRPAYTYLTAQTTVLGSNTTACPGSSQYFTGKDAYGLPLAWTYANGSTACVRVAYTPVTKGSSCQFWLYTPAGNSTSSIIFGYWVSGGAKNYATVNENPLEGWHRVFTAANVTAINFQDNNGRAYPEEIGWGTGTGHGMREQC